MQATLRHPLVKSLAFLSAALLTATLMAVTGGQSAGAVGPEHTTELAFRSSTVWGCDRREPFATIATGSYQRLRIVGRSLLTNGAFGADVTLTFLLAEGSERWEIGKLTIAKDSTQSTVIDVPGRSLVIRATCTGGPTTLGVLAYGN